MKPKISIIIPIHNVEKYLRQCLDSVLAQNYEDLEVIMINDGSTDSSGEIAKTYLRNKQWKYYETDGEGAAKARNYGINQAIGEYMLFLDSDDYLVNNALPYMVEAIMRDDLDVYGFSAYTFRDSKADDLEWDYRGYKYRGDYPSLETGERILEKMISSGDQDITCVWVFLIRMEYWKEKGIYFPEGIILEDNLVHYTLLAKAARVRIENIPLYAHRYHQNSVMASANTEKTILAMHKLLTEMVKLEKENDVIAEYSLNWYMHDYAWKYAGNWAKLNVGDLKRYQQLTTEVKDISAKHMAWGDKKLELFIKTPVMFILRQRLRKLVKS